MRRFWPRYHATLSPSPPRRALRALRRIARTARLGRIPCWRCDGDGLDRGIPGSTCIRCMGVRTEAYALAAGGSRAPHEKGPQR